MPFTSIYPIHPRTNPGHFREEILQKLAVLKISVLLSRPIWIFFSKKFFFASSQWKSVNIYRTARIGRNFGDYPGFQPQTTKLANNTCLKLCNTVYVLVELNARKRYEKLSFQPKAARSFGPWLVGTTLGTISLN